METDYTYEQWKHVYYYLWFTRNHRVHRDLNKINNYERQLLADTATKITPVIVDWGKEVWKKLEPMLANEDRNSSDNV